MTTDERKRLFDRIQKCMNLSKSSEPHEAAAALRQAQKLMNAHGISQADILGAGIMDEKIQVPIQATQKGVPVHLTALVVLMKKAFGVEAVISTSKRVSDWSYDVHYFGPLHRLPMVLYAHKVVYAAMEKAWKEALQNDPRWKGVRGARLSFMVGWIDAISSKVVAVGFTDEEKMAVDVVKTAAYPKLKSASKNYNIYGSVNEAGKASGSSFNLHRPMQGTQQKVLS